MSTVITPIIARSECELARLKKVGKDPIIHRENEHEVCVYTNSAAVCEHIRTGRNWHMGFVDPDEHGYQKYVYTRLSEAQLLEHLRNPLVHQGSDG